MKRYHTIDGQEYQIHLYYDLGGYRPNDRGYYLSVNPVKRETMTGGFVCVTMVPTDGVKKLVLPVNRKSGKAYQKALKMAESSDIKMLFDYLGVNYEVEQIG